MRFPSESNKKYVQVFKSISYEESLKWIKVFKDSPIYQFLKQIFGLGLRPIFGPSDLPRAKMLLDD